MQQLHLIAKDNSGLRPITDYILLTKENVYASDSHVAVIHKTENLFGKEFSEKMLETDRFLIHATQWKKLCKNGIVGYEFNGGTIKAVDKKGQVDIVPLIKEGNVGNYPKVESVIPEEANEKCDMIGLNPELLHNLQLAIYPEKPKKNETLGLYLKMSRVSDGQANGAIRVYINGNYNFDFKAVIMPIY
jgi:hypothetical protein